MGDGKLSNDVNMLAEETPIGPRIIGEQYCGLEASRDNANRVLRSKMDILVVGNKSL